ncbi:hypothetical protein LCGC14_0478740 [marine sediment metagenome]|uniref:Uncharacterized protein n=1 Tax=marine sediment metagenome TaxID=412755 RepID=A0A0F9SA07_9ZZZZ
MVLILHMHVMRKVEELGKKFQLKLAIMKNSSFFSATPEEIAAEEAEKKEREDAERNKNKKIWDIVSAWFADLGSEGASGSGLMDDYYDDIMSYDRKFSMRDIGISGFWKLDLGCWLNLSARVDMETGEITAENLRAGFKGRDIPEMMKYRIESATGMPLKYHAPTKAWVYDAQINGRMKEGDKRMASMAKTIISQDKKEL